MENKAFVINWIIVVIVVCVLLLVGVILFFMGSGKDGFTKTGIENPENISQPPESNSNLNPDQSVSKEVKDAAYKIDGKDVKLVDGKSGTIELLGLRAEADINNDGRKDNALILVDKKDGKNNYYIAVAVKSANGYTGTNALPINIAELTPEVVSVIDQVIIVDYANRKESDPVFERLATSVRKGFVLENGVLREEAQSVIAEKACIKSGGVVTKVNCCASSTDFSNNCLIGSCGCSPDNSKEVKSCSCPNGMCFNGNECIRK